MKEYAIQLKAVATVVKMTSIHAGMVLLFSDEHNIVFL